MNISTKLKTLPKRFGLAGAVALLVTAAATMSFSESAKSTPAARAISSNGLADPVSEGWLAQMRDAGMHNDRTQVHLMVETFQSPPGFEALDVAYETRLSLLRPLAELNATEALPALNQIIQSDPKKPISGQTYVDVWGNDQVIAASKVVKARIIAQSSTQGMTDDKSRASAEVKRFFQELGRTPASLNAAVASYKAEDRQRLEAAHNNPDYHSNAVPVELFAMRELADMAYRDRYRGFASLPDVARVDFGQDKRAALKARLAPLSRQQRITTLVDELSEEQISDNPALYRAQLLVDEGPSILPVIVSKQQYVKAHREQFRGKYGYFGGLSILNTAQEGIAAAETARASQPSSLEVNADMLHTEMRHSAYPRQLVLGY